MYDKNGFSNLFDVYGFAALVSHNNDLNSLNGP